MCHLFHRAFAAALFSISLTSMATAQVTWIPFQGHEYARSEAPLTWHQGQEWALSLGSNLACVTTAEENSFIGATFYGIHLWLGATDEVQEGQWHWVTGEPFGFTQWCQGEPNNAISTEDYLHFDVRSGGCWNDLYIGHPAAHPYALIERTIVEVSAGDLPASLTLFPFPNPFNPSTTIHYSLEQTGPTSLKVHDLSGRLVATLVDGMQERGTHEILFDGSALPSGMYVCTLVAGGQLKSQKIVLEK